MDLKEAQFIKGNNSSRHPWELARLEVIYSFLRKTLNTTSFSDLTIIDIGCGDLFCLESLSKKINFHKCIAVDTAFDEDIISAYSHKLENTNIKIYNSLEKCTSEVTNASIVLLLDVIEHIEDDAEFLRNLFASSFVTKDTIFLITVPAYQSLYCTHDKFLGHYRRYTNQGLLNLFKKDDCQIIESGYFFFSLLFPRIFQVSIEKMFKKSRPESGTGLTKWGRSKTLSNFLKQILMADFVIGSVFNKFNIKIPGLSTYLICKKSA